MTSQSDTPPRESLSRWLRNLRASVDALGTEGAAGGFRRFDFLAAIQDAKLALRNALCALQEPADNSPPRSPAAEQALAALIQEDSFRPSPGDPVLLPFVAAEPPADAFSPAGAAQKLRTAAEAIRRGHEQDRTSYGDRHVLVRSGDLDALLAALRRMETAELLSQAPAADRRQLQECPR